MSNNDQDNNDQQVTKLADFKTCELQYRQKFDKYVFMIWDGLRFFDFAFDKLPRLRGH